MRRKVSTKKALIMSVFSMLMCFVMLAGSTFAWFTDSETSGNNQIVAGNLDVELQHKVGDTYENVTESTKLFDVELWEPGTVYYETLKVSNEGTLALKYSLSMLASNVNYVVEADGTVTERSLADVLSVAVVEGEVDPADRDAVLAGAEFVNITELGGKAGVLLPKGTTEAKEGYEDYSDADYLTVVLYWEPNVVADNDYNLKNGAHASDAAEGEVGALSIDVSLSLVATQVPYEEDSFDENYDKDARFPRLTTGPALNSAIYNAVNNAGGDSYHKVKTITFADYDAKYGVWEEGYHVGATKVDDIRMFISENKEDVVICVQPGQKIIFSENCTEMFWNFVLLESIDFGPKDLISTENVTNMTKMFNRCPLLTELDLSGWDVSNVEYFGSMFNACASLKSIDMTGWNVTDKAVGFAYMFAGCSSVEELDLSGWNVSNVNSTGFKEMFNGCASLKTIYAEDWTVYGGFTNRGSDMFKGCVNLPGFDESKTDSASAKLVENGGYFTAK